MIPVSTLNNKNSELIYQITQDLCILILHDLTLAFFLTHLIQLHTIKQQNSIYIKFTQRIFLK